MNARAKFSLGDIVITPQNNTGKITAMDFHVFGDGSSSFRYKLKNATYFWMEASLKPLSQNDVLNGYSELLHAFKVLAISDNKAIDKSYVEEMLNNLQKDINYELNRIKDDIK